jgi:small subunit ribosomal protein S1
MNTDPNPSVPDAVKSETTGEPVAETSSSTPPAAPSPATPSGPTALPARNSAGPGQSRPPRPGAPRPGGASRPFPRSDKPFPKGDKPLNPGGAPPQLGLRDFGAHKPNNRELDKMIEDELNQSIAGFSVENTVAEPESHKKTQGSTSIAGQRKKGRVVGIHGKDVFIEVPGGRSQGVLPLQQFEGKTPAIGEEVEFDVERYDAGDGLLVLTREGSAQVVTDWSSVGLHMIVEARITGTNKNKTGVTVEVNGIKGFMPASQLDLYRVENLDQFLNQRLKVQVIEINPEDRNLIVSRRALLERERAQKAEQFWADIQEGQTRKGTVKSIKPFGAFVDLGGADGLIPVSEFSWQRVNDLNDYVKLGQEVQVMVARLDREARKIGLSLKQLTTSPWDEFATRVRVGARITGKVTRISDFGAFVELEPGIEGLIHISELSTQRVRRVRDIVSEGQTVEVEVRNMDATTRRIGLSLKSIAKEKEDAAEAAEEAERLADIQAAEQMMANRQANPKLRGGIGSNAMKFESES